MDPISMLMGGVSLLGLGIGLMGSMNAASVSNQIATANRNIAVQEQYENQTRNQQMYLTAQRQQTENLRRSQQAQAMGLAAAANQGAIGAMNNFGSGYKGGQAQAANAYAYNSQGLSQNLQLGQQMFMDDSSISMYRMQIATLQGQLATDQGMMQLGQGIYQAAGPLSKLLPGVGSGIGSLSGGFGPQNTGYGGMGGWS